MEKNIGLKRKRKKIDRNPRVKHREKFRKALIKRRSHVKEFKEGP
jgi:U3 small nucleolar RNA-associated protein 3